MMKTFKQFLTEAKLLHHATPYDYHPSEIKPWSHFGSSVQAKGITSYAADAHGNDYPKDPQWKMHKFEHHPSGKGLHLSRDNFGQGSFTDHTVVAHEMEKRGMISREEHEALKTPDVHKHSGYHGGGSYRQADPAKVDALLAKKNISHITYPNEYEGRGGRSTIVLRPADLKHVSTVSIKNQRLASD